MNPHDEALLDFGEWTYDTDGGHHPTCDLLGDAPGAECTCPDGWVPYSTCFDEVEP